MSIKDELRNKMAEFEIKIRNSWAALKEEENKCVIHSLRIAEIENSMDYLRQDGVVVAIESLRAIKREMRARVRGKKEATNRVIELKKEIRIYQSLKKNLEIEYGNHHSDDNKILDLEVYRKQR